MLNIDSLSTDSTCPRCGFYNEFMFKQVRIRDVIICRGCHANIRLDDHVNSFRKARASISSALGDLENTLKSLEGVIKIEL